MCAMYFIALIVREKFLQEKPLEGCNNIVASVCPQVFGLYAVKLSVLLVLIGGIQVGMVTDQLLLWYSNQSEGWRITLFFCLLVK